MLGQSGSLAYAPWPEADESLLVQSTYNLPVQVGGACGGQCVDGVSSPTCGGSCQQEGCRNGSTHTAAGCEQHSGPRQGQSLGCRQLLHLHQEPGPPPGLWQLLPS